MKGTGLFALPPVRVGLFFYAMWQEVAVDVSKVWTGSAGSQVESCWFGSGQSEVLPQPEAKKLII